MFPGLFFLHSIPALDTISPRNYFVAMQLRDHPLMRYRGVPIWPPVWTQVTENGNKTVRGEVGVLRYVHANPTVSSKCFLVIEHQDERYVGCMILDDQPFRIQVTTLLRIQTGRSIKEIGDLDLSDTL